MKKTTGRKNNFRIYLKGYGPGHYRPLVGWIKENIDVRKDRNGVPFIYIGDLLPYKDHYVGTNRHNEMKVDLSTLLSSKLIAFREIERLYEKMAADKAVIEALKKSGYLGYFSPEHLGYIWLHNKEVLKPYLLELGLEDWI